MAKKVSSLTLTGTGQSATMERGKLDPGKGKNTRGIRLKVTMPVQNPTAGALAMTAAQRKLALALLQIENFSYGKNGMFQRLAAQDFKRVRLQQKKFYGSEMGGFDDASTGLAKSIAAGATSSLVFFPIIPTGHNFRFPGRGMGRTQSRTVQLKLKQLGTTIVAATFLINGNVTVEVMPDANSCKGDPWCNVPEFVEQTVTDQKATLPEGLPLCLTEKTAVHASTALTEIRVKIDAEEIHDLVSPAEALEEMINDSASHPAAALISDEETILYDLPIEARKRDLPSGELTFVRKVSELATAALAFDYVAIPSESDVAAIVEICAEVRKKTVKAVNRAEAEGDEMPDRLRAFEDLLIVDVDDAEYDRMPGVAVAPGGKAQLHVPESVKARAKAAIAFHQSNGEAVAAAAITKRVVAATPSGAQSGRGVKGSGIFARLASLFA